MAISNALGHIPAGQLVDKFERRRELFSLSMLAIIFAITAIMYCHDFNTVLFIQIVVGIASAFIPPVLGSLSLGLVGHTKLAARLGRNDAFNHIGNVIVALLTGLGGLFTAIENSLFYLSCSVF